MSSLMAMSGRMYSINCFNRFALSQRKRHLCLSYQSSKSGSKDVIELNKIQDLETQLIRLQSKGGHTEGVLRRLVMQYSRRSKFWNNNNNKDQTKDKIKVRINDIMDEFRQRRYHINDGMYSSLMEFYINCEDIRSALDMKKQISKTFPLDSYKVFNLATLLATNGSTDEAIEMIKDECSRRANTRSFGHNSRDDDKSDELFVKFRDKSVNRLLNSLIDRQIERKVVKRVFLMCLEICQMKVNKVNSGPLIRMHLIQRDYSSALEEFVSCADIYHILPWSMELMRTFIQLKDDKSLQTVVQKSNEIYGQNNTCLDLTAAYVYNGLLNEAKVEAKNIYRLQQQSIEFVCHKFVRDNRLEELRHFIQITQNINGIHSQQLIDTLVNECNRLGQTDRAQHILSEVKDKLIDTCDEKSKSIDEKVN